MPYGLALNTDRATAFQVIADILWTYTLSDTD
jgi:hypothetical protein